MLRYEALSLAVAQLHMQTQASASMQPAAFSGAQASQQSMPSLAQQLQYAVGSGRDSPSHLVASRAPEKAHEPMFGDAQPQAEPANAQGTSSLLQVCVTCCLGMYTFTHVLRETCCCIGMIVSSCCSNCVEGQCWPLWLSLWLLCGLQKVCTHHVVDSLCARMAAGSL